MVALMSIKHLVSMCLEARNRQKSQIGSDADGNSPFLLPLCGLFAFWRGVVTWEHRDLRPHITEATYFSGRVEGSLI